MDHLREYDGKELVDVARGELTLPDIDDEEAADVDKTEHEALLEKMGKALAERVESVAISQRLVDSAACVVSGSDDLSPQIRRMLEANGQQLPESKPILEVNVDHPLVVRLSGEGDDERFNSLSNIVLDHALLAEGSQLENPASYVRRMNELLTELESGANPE